MNSPSPNDENKRLKSHLISQNYFIENCRKQLSTYIPDIGPNGDNRSLLKAISDISSLIDLLGNDLVESQKKAEEKLEFEFNKQLLSQQHNDREKRKLKEENFKILQLFKTHRESSSKQIDKYIVEINQQMMQKEDYRSELVEWQQYFYDQENEIEQKEYEIKVKERDIQKQIQQIEREKQQEIQKLLQENKLLRNRIQLIEGELKQSFERRVKENEKNFNFQINECRLQYQIEIEELNQQIKICKQEKFESQNEIKIIRQELNQKQITQEVIEQKDQEIEKLNQELIKVQLEWHDVNEQLNKMKKKYQTIETVEKEKNEEELNDIKHQYNKIVKEQQKRLSKQQQEYQKQMMQLQQNMKQNQSEVVFSVLTFDAATQYETQPQKYQNNQINLNQTERLTKQNQINNINQEDQNQLNQNQNQQQLSSFPFPELELMQSQYLMEIRLLKEQIKQQNEMQQHQENQIQKLQDEKQTIQEKLNKAQVKEQSYNNQLNQKLQLLQKQNNKLKEQIEQEQSRIDQVLQEKESNEEKVTQMEDNIYLKEEQLQDYNQQLIKAMEIVKYLKLELENYKKINNIFKYNYDTDSQLSFYPNHNHKIKMNLIQKTGQDNKFQNIQKYNKIHKHPKFNDLSLNFHNIGMLSDNSNSDQQSNQVKKLLVNTKEYREQKEKIFPKIIQLQNSFKVSNKPQLYSYSSRKSIKNNIDKNINRKQDHQFTMVYE